MITHTRPHLGTKHIIILKKLEIAKYFYVRILNLAMKRIRLDEAGASAPGTPADAGGSSRSSPAGTAHGLFGDPYSLDHLSSLAASLTEVAGDPSLVSGKVEVDRVAEWVGVAVLRDAARVLDAINRPIAALLELDADEGSDPGNSAAGTAVAMPGADCGCADDSLTGYAVSCSNVLTMFFHSQFNGPACAGASMATLGECTRSKRQVLFAVALLTRESIYSTF